MRKTLILEKILAGLASSIPLTESLFYRNSAQNTSAGKLIDTSKPLIYDKDITPYVGNWAESFAVPLASGVIGDFIEIAGKRRGSKLLEKLGKYLPEISIGFINAYFTLGESILPRLLPGTADLKDIPAVLFSSLAVYTLAKIGRKSRFNERLYSLVGKVNENLAVN